jgi:flavin reductase (DIM6/NTAB) family NADH-FMN oxidoreductase RutF
MPSEYHFYEPANGHGLRHNPFKSIVAPRPIGWISSRSADGVLNLAPYSFFNAFSDAPPIVGFSCTGQKKDTVHNVEQTGEFAFNLVTRSLAEAMNATSANVAPGVNEFELAGVTAAPSRLIAAPRVAESPVAFECKRTEILQLKAANGTKAPAWLVLGEVVGVHINKALLHDGIYETAAAGHLARGGGLSDYFWVGEETLLRMTRPG